MKPFLIVIACFISITVLRWIVTSMLSMASIGGARKAVHAMYQGDRERGENVASAVQNSLFQTHDVWLTTDVLFDFAIIGIFVIYGFAQWRQHRGRSDVAQDADG